MKLSPKLLVLSLLAASAVSAMATPGTASARALLAGASAKARAEKKNVMVIFHASWCGWCHRMDDMLESAAFKSIFNNSYVITHVVVLENGDKKSLENEGGMDLMAQLGAPKDSGIPYFAVLTPDGKKIGDSLLPNKQNMGYPSEPAEVAAFKVLLQKTAPHMTGNDISKVVTFLSTKKTG
ncbi:MAG: thioredoxin family protein [Fimbriimonas sp.]|nr:thioredoxin family protein [Fimbriimonas sp.]